MSKNRAPGFERQLSRLEHISCVQEARSDPWSTELGVGAEHYWVRLPQPPKEDTEEKVTR